MTVGGPSYEVFFYNHEGTPQFILEGWEFLNFAQRLNAPWNYQLRIELPQGDARVALIRGIESDWIFEVWRRDEVNNRTRVYEGFHRTTVDQVKQGGELLFTLYGTGYTDLLRRRVVVPPAGETHSTKAGIAESIMKEFVDESAVNPTDIRRIFPGLSVETDAGAGGTAEYSSRYINLFTVLSRCREQGLVDHGIVGIGSAGQPLFEYQVRPLWGRDRRWNNTQLNAPVVFDIFFHNMEIPIYTQNATRETNFVYVGGRGQALERNIQEFEDLDGTSRSPWNRIEAFFDARNSDDATLASEGNAYLEANKFKTEFTFNIRQTAGTQWLRDWNLGDIVTSRYFNLEFGKKIVEVDVVVSAGETGQSQIEVVTIEMEDFTDAE